MAKWVLLEFDDDEDADRMVEQIQAEEGFPEGKQHHVRGAFKKPTKFCDDPDDVVKAKSSNSKGELQSFRGSKWGWYVRKCCGRPWRFRSQSPRNLIATKGMYELDNGVGYMITVNLWNAKRKSDGTVEGWG